MSFKYLAHFLNSSRKRAVIPRVSRVIFQGDISFFEVERNVGL
jgi:hypothetical protein